MDTDILTVFGSSWTWNSRYFSGANNPFEHSGSEVVERLEGRLGKDKVYRADEDGTIELITDGEVRKSILTLSPPA
ncbi:MAG: hypothetical protein JW732_03080 [Dehalococcoidia bacterium]|nr:hypothetical protein [Dehalococcoidia bacterium]